MTTTSTDILIIGGGVIGLSIARELHRCGVRNITIVERGTCGREASWAAAGMLAPDIETDGTGAFFGLCCQSRDLYPDLAAELLEETGVDVELDRTGTIYVAFDDEQAGRLMKRWRRQSAAGIAVEILSSDDLRRLEPELAADINTGALYADDWQVENRKLVSALRKYCEFNGINIQENVHVERLLTDDSQVIGAETSQGSILSSKTVVATGAWTSLLKLGPRALPVSVKPIRGQIAVLYPPRQLITHVIESDDGYIVPRADGRLLIGSTSEDVGFDISTTTSAIEHLKAMAGRLLPSTVTLEIADEWAGLRPFAADGLPVIGEVPDIPGLMIATGHYRNGILLAPVTAKLVAKKIVDDVDNEVFSTFGPQRFSAAAVAS